jgi:hypothetical protein
VPPGAYKVQLLQLVGDVRNVLARVVIAKGTPVRWELAVRGKEDIRSLKPGQLFAYGVDTGTGYFVASGFIEQVKSHPVADAMLAAFKKNPTATPHLPGSGRRFLTIRHFESHTRKPSSRSSPAASTSWPTARGRMAATSPSAPLLSA